MARFVYILQLANGQYYVGSTNDVTGRLFAHHRGNTRTTRRLGVETLLFKRQYATKEEAREIEMFLKKQKSRAVIEKFMTKNWKNL